MIISFEKGRFKVLNGLDSKAAFKDYVPYSKRVAYERATPVKPQIIVDRTGTKRVFCGKCGGWVDDVAAIELTGNFCCLCGQKVDWNI